MEISLEDVKIHNLEVETDEAANVIEFQINGRIPNVGPDILEKVAGNRLVPKTVICEVE